MTEHAWWSGHATKRSMVRVEWATFALCLLFIVVNFWGFLTGETSVTHDALNVNLPLHHYMAHSLLQGRLPLWNPYTHGGEPFYPLLGHLRLYEPFSVLVVWFGGLFTKDTTILFNWDKFLQVVVNLGGVYLLLRPYSRTLVSKLCLILVLSGSSLFICSFRQDGFLSQFAWVPFLLFFCLRIFFQRDYRWLNFLGAGICLGLKWQSYWFVGAVTLLLFFGMAAVSFYREELRALWRSSSLSLKLGVVVLFNVGMLAPNLQLIEIQDRFDYPLRANLQQPGKIPKGTNIWDIPPQYSRHSVLLNYESVIQTGANMTIWDYLQMFAFANEYVSAQGGFHGSWGRGSEACLYLGAVAWILSLIGIFFSGGRQRRFWLFLLGGLMLLCLGPYGGLHQGLYYIFPPLWFLRNTHTFVLILAIPLLYFMVAGIDQLVGWMESEADLPAWPRSLWPPVLLYTAILGVLMWASVSVDYPLSLCTPLFIFVGVASGWLLRKRLAPVGYIFAILAMQWGVSLFYQPKLPQLILWWVWNAVLPVSIFLFAYSMRVEARRAAGNLFFGLLLAILACDLGFFLTYAWPHYQLPHPTKAVASAKTVSEPVRFPVTRKPYDYLFVLSPIHLCAFYYHSLFSKETSVLTPLLTKTDHQRLDLALKERRFTSLLVPRAHSDLVYSSLQPQVLERIFAVGDPLIAFRPTAQRVEAGKVVPYLESLPAAQATQLLESSVLIEGEVEQEAPAPVGRSDFSYQVRDFTESGLGVTVRAPTSGYFIWQDGFDPEWAATVDGAPVEILRANGFAKAIRVAAGEHAVSFKYRPVAFLRALALFWGCFWVALVAFAACALPALSRRGEPSLFRQPLPT